MLFGMNPAIKRAIEVLGSGAALATAINRSPQYVSQLLNGGRPVPAELCPLIEQATGAKGGVVRSEELRPDVLWSVLRTSSQQPAGEGARA